MAELVPLSFCYTGFLVAAFNGMLNQIQKRDQELCLHREHLEEEVESRTSELLITNTQLRHAKEKYRAIFEDAVIGIFQITPDGRPLSINRALAQMHGYDSPEDHRQLANLNWLRLSNAKAFPISTRRSSACLFLLHSRGPS